MRRILALMSLIATAWTLGWINRDLPSYPPAKVLPFSQMQPHSTAYNVAVLTVVGLLIWATTRLPWPRSPLRHVARNLRPATAGGGVAALAGLGVVLWGAGWLGRHARVPGSFVSLSLFRRLAPSVKLELAQFLSCLAVAVCAFAILAVYAFHATVVEREKAAALDLQFALAQRRRGIPAEIPGEAHEFVRPHVPALAAPGDAAAGGPVNAPM